MHRVEHIMGMPIVVEVRDDGIDPASLDDVFDWFRWVDETFSTFKPASQISRIAFGELDVADAHPDVQSVLERCEQLETETRGYFSAYAGGALDPSGLVKGWSVDRAAALLDAAAVREYSINAGGDVRVRGLWRVGIQHPLQRDAVAQILEAEDLAVATSGEYLRGRHVLDPHTGKPPEGILSVTVTGPDLATADAYATAALAMGSKLAPHWLARLRGYESMIILSDERVLSTPSLRCAA
jgi:thiamine biosynthesis lipoprotein